MLLSNLEHEVHDTNVEYLKEKKIVVFIFGEITIEMVFRTLDRTITA
jgi:hypothetical protein